MNRINDKIQEIEVFLVSLEEILPNSFEEYLDNFEKKLACERCFEKIVMAIVDLGFLTIKEFQLKFPEEDEQTFETLAKGNIIDFKLAEKLSDAKGMRNILAHEYGKVDDELVFESITEQIIPDTEEFIKSINHVILNKEGQNKKNENPNL